MQTTNPNPNPNPNPNTIKYVEEAKIPFHTPAPDCGEKD